MRPPQRSAAFPPTGVAFLRLGAVAALRPRSALPAARGAGTLAERKGTSLGSLSSPILSPPPASVLLLPPCQAGKPKASPALRLGEEVRLLQHSVQGWLFGSRAEGPTGPSGALPAPGIALSWGRSTFSWALSPAGRRLCPHPPSRAVTPRAAVRASSLRTLGLSLDPEHPP